MFLRPYGENIIFLNFLGFDTQIKGGQNTVSVIGTSSVRELVGTSLAVDSTLDLFVVPALGSTVFFCALRYLRKVVPIGAVRWTNSRKGNALTLRSLRSYG